jgi:hypothetical protein
MPPHPSQLTVVAQLATSQVPPLFPPVITVSDPVSSKSCSVPGTDVICSFHSYLEYQRLRIQQVSHTESLPVVFIDNELQLVNKHTNKSLEEKKLKTQYSLIILSDDQCAHPDGHNQ